MHTALHPLPPQRAACPTLAQEVEDHIAATGYVDRMVFNQIQSLTPPGPVVDYPQTRELVSTMQHPQKSILATVSVQTLLV